MSKLRSALGMVAAGTIGAAAGMVYEFLKEEKRIDVIEDQGKKMKCFYDLLVQWLALRQDGRNLKEYFEFNDYRTIAVYGMAELGQRLLEELRNTDIRVKYVVDRNADHIVADVPKFKPDDELEKVDALIVTAIYFYQDIEEDMEKKVHFPIISLEDVIYGLS